MQNAGTAGIKNTTRQEAPAGGKNELHISYDCIISEKHSTIHCKLKGIKRINSFVVKDWFFSKNYGIYAPFIEPVHTTGRSPRTALGRRVFDSPQKLAFCPPAHWT